MSLRVDTASLISGALVCGNRGLGVTGATILAETATGDSGPGYMYNDVDSGDEAKEFQGLIFNFPTEGTLFANENGSFSYTGTSTSFQYLLKIDGSHVGFATVTITVGSSSTVLSTYSISYLLRNFVGNNFGINYTVRQFANGTYYISYSIEGNSSVTVTMLKQIFYSILGNVSSNAVTIVFIEKNPVVEIRI